MYEIFVSKLKFKCIVGLLPHERLNPQKVVVDCQIRYNKESDFLDYSKVALFIEEFMKEKKFILLEDALKLISEQLIIDYPMIRTLKLKITKPNILKNCKVSVKKVTKINPN